MSCHDSRAAIFDDDVYDQSDSFFSCGPFYMYMFL